MEAIQQNIAVILISFFLIITFFFSAFEKILDWKNTTIFYANHFKKTVLKSSINFWVGLIIVFEIITLGLLIFGVINLILDSNTYILKIAFEISSIVFLMLLIGQRIAKDYVGATSITVYFILNILALYLIN
ncbi:DoxX family protein [Lutibacter sp. B1]|uniref:DoxX family protein n=1 Tax=Lutibacter sp. B1 TaxID=2725996 RepID=UPI0014578C43|nr:DoxX family protein [Lutibacter sp. B1]NLP57026.1 DoxX family protein [Lutibacter sp. B1]